MNTATNCLGLMLW